MTKTVDIEKLLQWTFREELPKGHPVSMSAWDAVFSYSRLGARVDVSSGGGSDGLGFVPGTPHADAEIVAQAVRELPAASQFTADECEALIGHYAALDPLAVRAIGRASFNAVALVIRCAVLGSRMEWDLGLPQAQVLRHSNNNAKVFGVGDEGQVIVLRPSANGSYRFADSPRAHVFYAEPTIGQLLETRAEYTVWHRALVALVAALKGKMKEHDAAMPAATATPWDGGQAAPPVVHQSAAERLAKLPLGPRRAATPRPYESDIERQARESRTRRRVASTGEGDISPRNTGHSGGL